jgi:hypothetical protein
MPIEAAITARCFRLAFGIGLATFAAYGLALPLGYLLLIVVLALLAQPAPPPAPRIALIVVIATLLTSLYGLLLGPVLTYVPVAGVLLSLAGVAVAVVIGARPGLALIGTLMILSSTIIAVVAAQSSAAAATLVKLLSLVMVGAMAIAHLAHAVFPEPAGAALPAPPPAPANVGRLALRTAIIMAPPLVLALANPGAYIMLLMKGASLAQQAERTAVRRMAGELIGATAVGGVAALLLWNLLQLWPGLLLLCLGMTLAALLMARPLHGAIATRFSPDFWQFALTTLIILIGPAVADSASSDNIQRSMIVRLATFFALAVYAAVAVRLLDRPQADSAATAAAPAT